MPLDVCVRARVPLLARSAAKQKAEFKHATATSSEGSVEKFRKRQRAAVSVPVVLMRNYALNVRGVL